MINFIITGIQGLFSSIPSTLKKIGTTALDWFKGINWSGVGRNVINFIINGLNALVTSIPRKLKSIGEDAVNSFKSIDWFSLGKSVIDGIVNGIANFGSAIGEKLQSIASGALEGVKGFLGIKSPSKVFRDQVGKFIPEGIAAGIEMYSDYATNSIDDLASDLMRTASQADFGISIPVSYVPESVARENSQELKNSDALVAYIASGSLVNDLTSAISKLRIEVDNRDFGRLVQKYA